MANVTKRFISKSEKPKNASFWYNAKPGKTKEGKDRPTIKVSVSLTADMVKQIIAIGEIGHDEEIKIDIAGWVNDYKKNETHPTHKGMASFRQPKNNQQSKSA